MDGSGAVRPLNFGNIAYTPPGGHDQERGITITLLDQDGNPMDPPPGYTNSEDFRVLVATTKQLAQGIIQGHLDAHVGAGTDGSLNNRDIRQLAPGGIGSTGRNGMNYLPHEDSGQRADWTQLEGDIVRHFNSQAASGGRGRHPRQHSHLRPPLNPRSGHPRSMHRGNGLSSEDEYSGPRIGASGQLGGFRGNPRTFTTYHSASHPGERQPLLYAQPPRKGSLDIPSTHRDLRFSASHPRSAPASPTHSEPDGRGKTRGLISPRRPRTDVLDDRRTPTDQDPSGRRSLSQPVDGQTLAEALGFSESDAEGSQRGSPNLFEEVEAPLQSDREDTFLAHPPVDLSADLPPPTAFATGYTPADRPPGMEDVSDRVVASVQLHLGPMIPTRYDADAPLSELQQTQAEVLAQARLFQAQMDAETHDSVGLHHIPIVLDDLHSGPLSDDRRPEDDVAAPGFIGGLAQGLGNLAVGTAKTVLGRKDPKPSGDIHVI